MYDCRLAMGMHMHMCVCVCPYWCPKIEMLASPCIQKVNERTVGKKCQPVTRRGKRVKAPLVV